eukprot:8007173-Prorocentrum_lima.AAC.1
MWLQAWWHNWLPHDIMMESLMRAAQDMEKAGYSWRQVRGPATATALSIHQLGWKAVTGSEWLVHGM